jgi:hypothetical protein
MGPPLAYSMGTHRHSATRVFPSLASIVVAAPDRNQIDVAPPMHKVDAQEG